MIRTFGEPGGIYLVLGLDLDNSVYFVTNEDGETLFASPDEKDAVAFCEGMEV